MDLSWLFDRGAGGNEVYVELANDPEHLNYVGCSALWLVGANNVKCVDGRYLKLDALATCSDSIECGKNGLYPALLGSKQNPGYGKTSIAYQLPIDGEVSLKVFNMTGQLVRTLVNGWRPAGVHTIQWDGADNNGKKVSQGVYLYRMHAGSFTDTKKLIWMK